MHKVVYLDRARIQITPAQWAALRANKEYEVVRRYDNGKLRVTAEWVGKCIVKNGQPVGDVRPFRLTVENILTTDAEGHALPAPKYVGDVSATEEYRTEAALIASYEDLLVRYAGCEWLPSSEPGSDGQRFIERGNKLAPLDPKIPIQEEGLDVSSHGSW